VWKNIRERVQKYDSKLTKIQPVKKIFSLIGLAFQEIMLYVIFQLSYFEWLNGSITQWLNLFDLLHIALLSNWRIEPLSH
jgi:hypothetical protein